MARGAAWQGGARGGFMQVQRMHQGRQQYVRSSADMQVLCRSSHVTKVTFVTWLLPCSTFEKCIAWVLGVGSASG